MNPRLVLTMPTPMFGFFNSRPSFFQAAQRKFVHILHLTLKPKGIFVAEVTVMGTVRGTPFDPTGTSPLTAESIADTFHDVYVARAVVFTGKA